MMPFAGAFILISIPLYVNTYASAEAAAVSPASCAPLPSADSAVCPPERTTGAVSSSSDAQAAMDKAMTDAIITDKIFLFIEYSLYLY